MSNSFLVTVIILLWIVVLILAVTVYSLARQVGVLYERVAPAGALAINQKIKAGIAVDKFPVKTLSGDLITIGESKGRSQLIFFLSPDCPICKQLLRPLKSTAQSEKDWLDIILSSDGENTEEHRAFIEREKLTAFHYVISETLGKNFGVSKLPYGVLIDEQGKIASLGIINSREHLESLFEAKELGISDIQSYMERQNSSVSDSIARPEVVNR